MALIQLFDPGNLSEKHWHEDNPVDRFFVPADTIVSRKAPDFYKLDAQVEVLINDEGPVVRRRDCSKSDFDCNFWRGDAILVSRDPSPSADTLQAPIRLLFSHGLRALGAWLAVSPVNPNDTSFMGSLLTGYLWVRLASQPMLFEPVISNNGITGRSLQPGTPVTAPFVGVRADPGDPIVEARFDAGLMGNRRFDRIALSELYFEV